MNNRIFLNLLSDTTFKYLFKSENGRRYLNKVLQIITGINIEDYILIDNEFNSGNIYRDYKTDILLFNKEKNIAINIEMNQFKNEYYVYRNYTYISRIISEMFNKGEKIKEYKVIQVNFNNFYNKDNKNISSLSFILRDKLYDIELDIVKVIEIYIPTYKGVCYNGKNEEEMYLSMYNANSYEELKDIVRDNKEGLSIMDEIEYLAAKEGVIGLYNREREEKRIRATLRDEGYEEGKLEGIEEERENIAINSLEKGLDERVISDITGLSLERIKEIKNKK